MANMKDEARLSARYILAGGATTAVSVGAYWLLYDILLIGNMPAAAASWITAVAFAFFANKLFVFRSRAFSAKALFTEAALFLAARVATGILEMAAMYITVDVLNQNGTLMKLITNVAVIILNYLLSKLIIFKKK